MYLLHAVLLCALFWDIAKAVIILDPSCYGLHEFLHGFIGSAKELAFVPYDVRDVEKWDDTLKELAHDTLDLKPGDPFFFFDDYQRAMTFARSDYFTTPGANYDPKEILQNPILNCSTEHLVVEGDQIFDPINNYRTMAEGPWKDCLSENSNSGWAIATLYENDNKRPIAYVCKSALQLWRSQAYPTFSEVIKGMEDCPDVSVADLLLLPDSQILAAMVRLIIQRGFIDGVSPSTKAITTDELDWDYLTQRAAKQKRGDPFNYVLFNLGLYLKFEVGRPEDPAFDRMLREWLLGDN